MTLDSLGVDERHPPVMKMAYAQHHVRLLATVSMDNPLEFIIVDVMKLHVVLEKLNKIFVTNLKWQHQQTIDSFFKST